MLMEMSGDIRPEALQQQQYHHDLPATDISIQPGLAFDFSLPMDTNTLAPFHSTFDGSYHDWLPNPDSSSLSEHGFSQSL